MPNITLSTTSLAWQYWKEEAYEHKHRKDNIVFDGRTFRLLPKTTTAKGVSKTLYNFLFNPTPQIPNEFVYSLHPPYGVHPNTFQDLREWADDDYESIAYPGKEIPDDLQHQIRGVGGYTTWSTGDPAERHLMTLPHLFKILDHVSKIVHYWHISLSMRLPMSQEEEFSAFMNAVGLGYLYHRSLPVHRTSVPGRLEPNQDQIIYDSFPDEPVYAPNHLCTNCNKIKRFTFVIKFAGECIYICEDCSHLYQFQALHLKRPHI